MAVWFQRWSTAVLRGEGGWVAGRRWEFLGGFFFQLGLRGLKQNAVDDWSAGRGFSECATTWGWVLGKYWRSMDLGHLLATWG